MTNTIQSSLASSRMHIALVCALLVGVLSPAAVLAEIRGPYEPDADTLHLYHFDEDSGVVVDEATGDKRFGLQLSAGANLASQSYTEFGTALTTDRKPTARSAMRKPTTTESFWNPESCAFTYEALVRMDFTPGEVMEGRTERMIIFALDSEDRGQTRSFQLALRAIGVSGATAPSLEFVKFANISGEPIQTLVIELPNAGPHVPEKGCWYHVAVTYTGQMEMNDNLKIYWTRLSPEETEANLLQSSTIRTYLGPQKASVFAVGNSARTRDGVLENWVGAIDEVRISRVARDPSDFLFRREEVSAEEAAARP